MRPGKAVLSAGACALVLLLTPAMALASAPNDSLYPQQWALNGSVASIHAAQAWCASTGSTLVADVDTGADFSHPDLAGKLVPGAAFLGSSNGVPTGTGQAAVQDGNGHGTMTTGIMVANTNNGIGIAAVAPAAKALIVKVLADDGTGNASDVAAGIEWAANYPGVAVINLSIGSDQGGLLSLLLGPGPNPILPAIDYALSRGVMVAAAAGNTAGKTSEYAGLENRALVVGALAPGGGMASYSEAGNIFAPGGDGGSNKTPATSVTSTGLNGVYMAGDGTSFAAPQVAGAVALLMARGLNAAQARAQILAGSTSPNGLPQLDAANALGVADNAAPCVAGAATPAPVHAPAPRPRPVTPPPPVALAPAPSPTPSPSASPSPQASVSPSDTPSPDAGTLAVRTTRPRQQPLLLLGFAFTASDSLWLLAAGLIGGMAAGYGALFFIKAVGRD